MEQVDSGYTELRSYQWEMKHRLYEKWWGGSRSVMVQMPTGTGKTFLMAAVVRGRGVGRDAPDRIGRADFGNLVSFRSTSRGDCRWPEGVVGGERPGGEHTDVEPMYR